MISDGIENCIMYIDNFDSDKYTNPFAYFTQIIYYAFIRRIQKEKKQTLIKGKIIMEMPFEAFEVQDHDDNGSYASSYVDFMQMNGIYGDVIAKDNERKAKVKQKKSKANLDEMLESDNIVDEME
jgi:DNA-directed RNA polymerase specialized sigma24 family protein